MTPPNPNDPYYLDNLKADYDSACKNAISCLQAYHNGQSHVNYILGVMWEESAHGILELIKKHERPKEQ